MPTVRTLGALTASLCLLAPAATAAAPAPRHTEAVTTQAVTTEAVTTAAIAPGLPVPAARSLTEPVLRDRAMQVLATAENGTLDWRAQYGYIEYNVESGRGLNRGYTGGLVGFTSRTHDMYAVVRAYVRAKPRGNRLARYLPALRAVDGTSSARGLRSGFLRAWRASAADPVFRRVQDRAVQSMYLGPAVRQARADGLGELGQFIYFDAIVMHGAGPGSRSFQGIRAAANRVARTPARGGNQRRYLDAFLDRRVAAMRAEYVDADVSRVETAQRRFLRAGNLALRPPLRFSVYGTSYTISR